MSRDQDDLNQQLHLICEPQGVVHRYLIERAVMSRRGTTTNDKGSTTPRKLRSKEAPKIDSTLFNYEEDPNLIDPEQPLEIVDVKNDAQVLIPDFQIDKGLFNFETNLKTVKTDEEANGSSKRRNLRKSTVVRQKPEDPLTDELYTPYNRRMEKEEKKMINWERDKIYSEADKMKSQLASLQQNDWMKILPTITYIRDPRNQDELLQKKNWTVESLNALLKRFEDWKKSEDKVLGKVRAPSPSTIMQQPFRYYTNKIDSDLLQDSDTDEEEELMSVAQIKRHRLKKKLEKYGPIIKIKFGNQVIIAEPFKATRIEKRK